MKKRKRRKKRRPIQGRPPLTVEQILSWVDAHRELTGAWPRRTDGIVHAASDETWVAINRALQYGHRGLPGGSSVTRLLAEQRGVRNRLVPLTEETILAWADAHHTRTGEWPKQHAGAVADAPEENWSAINSALWLGSRGLPGGTTLPRLLAERRGKRHLLSLPLLTEEGILAWADAHHERTGEWPTKASGPIPDASEETWATVEYALCEGRRGQPGGSSLLRFLAEHRGVRNRSALPLLTEEGILAWADAHHGRTGEWPRERSGKVVDAPEENWAAINMALLEGCRGLPGGSTVPRLLAQRRGKRNHLDLPSLTEEGILAWADVHHARSGKWPTTTSGPITDAPGESWCGINSALAKGIRGLPGGSSLPGLLTQHRGVRNRLAPPLLTEEGIVTWADAHHTRHGEWPRKESGLIAEAPGESWLAINYALRDGRRGLPGGSSLSRLLALRRGARNSKDLPPLGNKQILAWADAHHARTGRWPASRLGAIMGAPGETWRAVDTALARGKRGLPGGTTLARFLREHGRADHTS